ncbi:MAG: hypothetical protein RLZZ499_2109 [Cyanobacteriota bacterium]|jgi:hypothetical protein
MKSYFLNSMSLSLVQEPSTVKSSFSKRDLFLEECLLNETSDLAPQIMQNLRELIHEYKLEWFPRHQNKGVYFLIKEITKIKPDCGAKNLPRAWYSYKKQNNFSDLPLAPAIIKLNREEIKELSWRQPKLNLAKNAISLNICNWSLIYAWFISPKVPAITTNKNKPKLELEVSKITEKEIQAQLHSLSGMTKTSFVYEVSMKDHVTKSNSRRLDLVRTFHNKTIIYELKTFPLTSKEMVETLVDKAYLELAQAHFENTYLEFYFVAPEITDSGVRFLRNYGTQIKFISLYDLAQQLKQEVLDNVEPHDYWFYEKRIREVAPLLFPAPTSGIESEVWKMKENFA